ncbi:hypothetical protein LDI01_12730 [Lentilactobacillus diolivorans]|nr:hypothetical protein LDI01_12730 [Lentilactobacillus diolivorans]
MRQSEIRISLTIMNNHKNNHLTTSKLIPNQIEQIKTKAATNSLIHSYFQALPIITAVQLLKLADQYPKN